MARRKHYSVYVIELSKDVLYEAKFKKRNPDYIIGASTTLHYKRFALTAVIESVQGLDVFDADKRTRQGVGIGEYAEQELSGELPRGWVWAIYPILDWRIEDGSFTKIREVTLSYTIPDIGGICGNWWYLARSKMAWSQSRHRGC